MAVHPAAKKVSKFEEQNQKDSMSRIHEALMKAELEQKGGAYVPAARDLQPLDLSVLQQVQTDHALALKPTTDVDEITPGSLLSGCSHSTWQPAKTNMLFLGSDIQTTPWAEQFRALRSRLYRIRQKQSLKIILVTSSLPREGKSFVSANLSQIFAQQSGCRTLLIDGDLRWSRLHEYLGAPCSPGLPDYLAGSVDEFAIVQRSPVPDLFFIPGGQVRNPAELIGNGRMKRLLNALEPFFNWIVIDAPPASVVSDVAVLSGVCHGIVMVVRSGFTRFGVAQKAREELKDRPLLGVVLNAVPEGGHSDYYGGYYAGAQDRSSKGHEQR